jgi:hypothetical protein
MAKRKAARAGKRKIISARTGGSRPLARAQKLAARRGAAARKSPARRAGGTARKAARKSPKRHGVKATTRKAATRRTTTTKRRATSKRTATTKRTAVARTRARTASTGRHTPAARTAAAPRSTRRKVPALNRERRIAQDEDLIPSLPSSLDLDRSASTVRTGRLELKDRFLEHTETSQALTGGDNTTPDQDVVDAIGKALGVQYDDNEELKGEEKITDRDRKRYELDPASSEDYEDR